LITDGMENLASTRALEGSNSPRMGMCTE
jgi:hypothetical protein